MNVLQNLYELLIKVGGSLQSVVLLLLRLTIGFGFFQAGLGKFKNWQGVVGHFEGLTVMNRWQLPMPEVSLGLAAGAELAGGALLAVGLGARLVSVPLAFTMVVAYLTAHWSDITVVSVANAGQPKLVALLSQGIALGAFPYLAVSLVVLAFGPGAISLDNVVRRFFAKDE